MRCQQAQKLISHYIDQCLPENEKKQVGEHLEECRECRQLHEELRGNLDILQNMVPPGVPLSLQNDLKRRMLHEKNKFFNRGAAKKSENRGWIITSLSVISLFIGIHISSFIPAMDFLPFPPKKEVSKEQETGLKVDDILQRIKERWEKNAVIAETVQEEPPQAEQIYRPVFSGPYPSLQPEEKLEQGPEEVAALEPVAIDRENYQFIVAEKFLSGLEPEKMMKKYYYQSLYADDHSLVFDLPPDHEDIAEEEQNDTEDTGARRIASSSNQNPNSDEIPKEDAASIPDHDAMIGMAGKSGDNESEGDGKPLKESTEYDRAVPEADSRDRDIVTIKTQIEIDKSQLLQQEEKKQVNHP